MGYKQGKFAFRYANFLGYRRGQTENRKSTPKKRPYPHDLPKLSQWGQPAEDQGEARVRRGCSLLPAEKIGPRRPSSGFCKTKNIWGMSCCKRRLPPISWKDGLGRITGNSPNITLRTTIRLSFPGKYSTAYRRKSPERKSKHPAAKKHTKTNRGKFTSKYALSERLVCGDCGSAYRRVTWSIHGRRQIVWRCINRSRMDEGVPAFPQHRGRNITQRNMESNSIPDSRETGRNFSRPFRIP